MSLQKHLTEIDVIKDFSSNIDDFCEQYHIETGKPRVMICTIMIMKFDGRVQGGKSSDWMRKRIDDKYKMTYRVNNVKQKKISKVDRLKANLKKAESALLEATHEVSSKVSKDF